MNSKGWHGEPDLRDMLADPVIRSVMDRDRVDAEELLGLAERLGRWIAATGWPRGPLADAAATP